MSVRIIAEVGPNHNGREDIAFELIRQLAACDVDAIKFQLGAADAIYSKDAFKAEYQRRSDGAESPVEMTKGHQLPQESHLRLADACREAGVSYLCTGFDLDSLAFLDRTIDIDTFKIPSGEILTLDLLEYIAATQKPILLSTGMATYEEIEISLNALERNGRKAVTILHCVSNYPTPPTDVHLRVMGELAKRFERPVGFSDHTLGNECAIAAVALGASVIEKHVTLDKSMKGPDHQASATVDEFAELVRTVRNVERALGGTDKVFSAAENGVRDSARKSIAAARDLQPGDRVGASDLCFKRPGTGISPMDRDSVVGRVMKTPVEEGRLIRYSDLQ